MSRLRKAIRDGGELTAIGVAKALFIFALITLGTIAVTASFGIVAAILATFLVYLMIRAVLPAERIDEYTQAFWRGEPFVTLWNRFWRLIP